MNPKSRMIGLGLAAFLAALSACSGKPVKPAVEGPKREGIPLVGTLQVNRFTLDNGLRLLVV